MLGHKENSKVTLIDNKNQPVQYEACLALTGLAIFLRSDGS